MRAVSRFLLILLLTAPVTVVVPGATAPALAACESSADLATALDRANSVFVGEVIALADAGQTATMRVVEVWKGRDLAGAVKVDGAAADGSKQNNRTFQLGRTYLVESRDTRPPFDSDRCTATKIYSPLGGRQIPANLAAVIGTNQARPPLSMPGGDAGAGEGGTSWLPFVNIGLVLLAIVGVVWMYNKVTKVETRKEREAAARAELAKSHKAAGKAAVDPLSKVGRKLSITGSIGRSGLESSKRLRGSRGRAVATRRPAETSPKSKKTGSSGDVTDS